MAQFRQNTGRTIAGFVLASSMLAAPASAQVRPSRLPQLISPPPAGHAVPRDWPSGQYDDFVELVVSPSGDVIGCRVTWSSAPISYSAATCQQLQRDKFSPAIDADGKPAYGMVSMSFSWPLNANTKSPVMVDIDLSVERLPSGASIHPVSKLSLTVDADGHIEHCDLAGTSGLTALDISACKIGPTRATIHLIKNDAGIPVRSVQELLVGFGTYVSPIFKRSQQYAALGDAGPYFPDKAVRFNASGYATLDCVASPAGELTKCEVVEETPLGFAFGIAALKMVQDKWMKAPPGPGGHVLLRIDFPPSRHFLR